MSYLEAVRYYDGTVSGGEGSEQTEVVSSHLTHV